MNASARRGKRVVTHPCLMALLPLLFAAQAWAEQPRFYLSTDRVFSPADDAIGVQLEARGLERLDFRLYRIGDPRSFFLGQRDLHRIETQNGPKRVSSLDVLSEIRRLTMENALALGRSELAPGGRAAGRESFPEQVDHLRQEAARVAPPATAVPLLRDFELVDMWREDLQAGEGGWTYQRVAITTRRPGVYLLEAVNGHEVGYTIAIISRFVLLTRQSKGQFLVYAADPDLGTPVEDVEVELFSGNKSLGRGQTDGSGLWSKELPLTRQLTVLAKRGPDFALVDPTYHPANLFARKVYLTTERPVYRPQQTVYYKGIIRAYKDERYGLEEGQEQVTITVRDPNGQVVHTGSARVGEGSFDGRFELHASAAMGTYRLLARVGDKDYAGEFKVKAYRKPEYQVRVSTAKGAVVSGEKVRATIAANYYFGPPVKDARVRVSVYRTRFYIPWWVDADYSWYYSDAEYRNTMREIVEEGEGRLDEKGEFHLDFATLADSLDYVYGIEAVVTDASQQVVTGHGSLRVTQAQFRLALEPEYLLNAPGGQARVLVRSTDFARKPVTSAVQLKVSARTGSDPAQAKEVPVLTSQVDTGAAGQAWFAFSPERSGTYDIEAKAKDDHGNEVLAHTRLFVTSDGGDIPYAPQELEIVADRRVYHVGDKARFLVLSPHADAHLFITVEGGRLYHHRVQRARGHSAVFEFEIEEPQAPNFFFKAATVFDRALYERRLDVVVPPREKLLQVAIGAEPAQVKPGQQVDLQVQVLDHRGEPVRGAEVALGLVDEAIYGISPEIAVPIARFFYHRKRNDVRSTNSFDFRFYGYGEDTKDRMAALHLRQAVVPGSFKAAASQVRKEFKDTLAWAPRLKTDAQGIARTRITAPDNLTTWRATARVITPDTRVGQGLGSFRVSKPVVLRIAAPTFLVEGDQSTFGLVVHNYTKVDQEFKLSLKSDAEHLEIEGVTKSAKVAAGQAGLATFQVRGLAAGQAQLRAEAQGQTESDALEQVLPIRAYGLEQVLLSSGVLDDANPSAQVELAVPESADPRSVRASVAVSSGVAPALLASLDYLTGYPYGCTEQTMSRFLPDLVVARALEELGVEKGKMHEELPGFIQAGLARLRQLQHDDGGWGWWENDASDPSMTAYVVHGLALAKRLGQSVDQDMLNRGANRLKNMVRSASLSATGRSYLLYSLAMAGVKYESMLGKLADDPASLSEYGRALLAMALFELGQKERAAAVANQVDLVAHTGPAGSHWGESSDRPGWEHDPVETTAAVLRSLLIAKPDSVNIPAAVRWLMSVRDGDRWQSTRDTSMAVFALVDYLKKAGGAAYQAEVSASLNGKASPARSIGRAEVFQPSVTLLTEQAARTGKNTVALSRKGKGDLFFNAAIRFFGREDPIVARGDRLGVTRTLYRVVKQPSGDRWTFSKTALTGPVAPGDEILVELDLSCAQSTDFVLVEDPLPGGVQAVDRDQGYQIPGVVLQQKHMHREFRDQQVAFFISNLPKGKRKLAYLVRATLPGNYHLLPTRVLPMYDPQFAGNSDSQTLRVEDR